MSEKVPPPEELFARAEAIVDIAMPEPLERTAMEVLRQTTLMPITLHTALETCAPLGPEELAQRAIENLQSLHLCALQKSADGDEILFNPNVWAVDKDHTHAAVQENGVVRAALSGLLEEVSATAGLPEEAVTSADKKWIDFAVSQGLLLALAGHDRLRRRTVLPVLPSHGTLRLRRTHRRGTPPATSASSSAR